MNQTGPAQLQVWQPNFLPPPPPPPGPGVPLPAAGVHAPGRGHLRDPGAAGGGERPDGGTGEADAEEELLHLHPDHRQQRHERGHGQPG